MPVVSGHAELEKLTRRHAIKILPSGGVSVEEAGYAVGEVVGFQSVKSASRMNSAIVIFLDDVAKVEKVVEQGVVINGSFTPVLPLVSPAKKVVISNAPPFIKNADLERELSRFGQLVSPIKMVLLAAKSAKLKHVVCHRRQVYMILKDNTGDLNVSFGFKIDGFSYVVFATSDTMKCYGCGAEGHLIRSCPERNEPGPSTTESRQESERPAEPGAPQPGTGPQPPAQLAAAEPQRGASQPDAPQPDGPQPAAEK